jgi:hypothetical protein
VANDIVLSSLAKEDSINFEFEIKRHVFVPPCFLPSPICEAQISVSSLYSAVSRVNYAHYAGIKSVEAAIIFAALYILLIVIFVYQLIRLPRYFIPELVFFFCGCKS